MKRKVDNRSIRTIQDKDERIERMKGVTSTNFKIMAARCESLDWFKRSYKVDQDEAKMLFEWHGVPMPWFDGKVVGMSDPMFRLAFYSQWSNFNSKRRSNFAYRM